MIELLVVIAIIGILASMLLPALGKALLMYGHDNQGKLPDRRVAAYNAGSWPWDMPRVLTTLMDDYGLTMPLYYAPANHSMNISTSWNYNPGFRVTGYIWLIGGHASTIGGHASTIGGHASTIGGHASTIGGHASTIGGHADGVSMPTQGAKFGQNAINLV